jgi:hypothetical protein
MMRERERGWRVEIGEWRVERRGDEDGGQQEQEGR